MKTNIKTLVISLSLIASANAFAGLGGVNVQSNLGEPFSGSIVVTGKEAEALINNRNVSVSGSGVSGTVIPQSNGTAIVRLRSNNIINEPIIHFVVSAGNQRRQYSAMINPSTYRPSTHPNVAQTTTTPKAKPTEKTPTQAEKNSYRKPSAQKQTKGKKTNVPASVMQGKGSYHLVQAGETVSILADRYRPQNMTHAQAVQAIIAANPRVFKGRSDGSLLYKDINIYIPFKSSDADGTPSASTESNTPAAPQTQTNTPSASTGNATPATPVQTEPVSTPEPTPAAPKNAETTTPVEQTTPVASEPAPAASEVVASEPQTETASTPEASEASGVTETAQPEPVVIPTEPAQPESTPEPEPESSSDIPWGLLGLGGAALLGLGGLGYALYRRKNATEDEDDDETWEDDDDWDNEDEDDDEDDFVEEKEKVVITTAQTTPVQEEIVNESVTTQPVVNDFVVNTPVADTQHQVVTENVEFNDNLFTEDFTDDFTNQTQSVVDNIQDTTFDLGDVAKTAAVAGAAATVSAATNVQQQEVVETYDDWLEDFSITDETAQPQQAVQQTEPAVADSDSWLNDFAELDTPANHANVETVVADVAEETPEIDSALDFVVTDTVVDEKPVAPAVSTVQEQENDSSDLDILNFVLKDEPEVSSTKPEPIMVQEPVGTPTSVVDEAYSALSLNKETEVVSAKQSAVHSNVSTDSIRDEWFDAPSTPNSNEAAGFVSESIGMAAPLEAKLELAKMYLEIDDAVAARETLRELVNEATGEIQEAAQKLLAELGN